MKNNEISVYEIPVAQEKIITVSTQRRNLFMSCLRAMMQLKFCLGGILIFGVDKKMIQLRLEFANSFSSYKAIVND